MKITFLLPNINLRGGVRIVVDYANLLADDGHDVTVVFPTRLRRLPFPVNEIEFLWRGPQKLLTGRWFENRFRLLPVPSLSAMYVPRADVVVATAWQTADHAASYPHSRGERFYFIQDVETYDGNVNAARSYSLPFKRIVTSPWIREQLRVRFGSTVHSLVPDGLDLALYRPSESTRPTDPIRVGALFNKSRRKGFDLALQALSEVRKENARVEMHVMGVPRSAPSLPAFVHGHWHLRPSDTVSFYQSCHVWLGASRSEGMHLPPMEAMACGCAVVTTRVGGTSYYAIPERTALVCEPGDALGLYRALSQVVADPQLRDRLVQLGVAQARRLNQGDSAKALVQALSGNPISIEPESGLAETHCD